MTAQNAQMDCIPVSWGFRSREFLIEHGAEPSAIAANVKELKAQL
jgi:phosphoglycolate phosphatase-like HAD superfamily hydrolase